MSGRDSLQFSSIPTSSLVPKNLATLADPPVRQIDAAAMDYLLIELVNTLKESSAIATARQRKVEKEMIEAGLIPPPPQAAPAVPKKESPRDSVTSLNSKSGKIAPVDEEEEAVRVRLEAIGTHVGANFTER